MRLVTLASTLALLAGLVVPAPARAACLMNLAGEVICGNGPCAIDLLGQVRCARSRFGSVVRTLDGQVVCGRGRCVTTLRGEVICSAFEGGGVVTQIDGTVRCDGYCETASLGLCEARPAGR